MIKTGQSSVPCLISSWGCIYHACMSDDCQKAVVLGQGFDWGFGKCENKEKGLGGHHKTQYNMKPTIGRIMLYHTKEEDRAKMRAASILNNGCNVHTQLPAVVVAVWGETCVNLKVICDGNLDLWVTSSNLGDQPGNWEWPVIE